MISQSKRMDGRMHKLFGDHRFRCPNGHTNDEKALKNIWIGGRSVTLKKKKKSTKLDYRPCSILIESNIEISKLFNLFLFLTENKKNENI